MKRRYGIKKPEKMVRFDLNQLKTKPTPLFHSTHYTHCLKYLPKEHKIDRQKFINLTRFIMSQVERGLIEEQDGVVLDGFGYFFNFITPKTRHYYYTKKNRQKNIRGRGINAVFKTIDKNNPLTDYFIPYKTPIQIKIKDRSDSGQLYTFHLSLLQNRDILDYYDTLTEKGKRREQKRLQEMQRQKN